MISALYVQTDGCYYGLPNVDPWDIHRDARKYDGPWPVVAHPPCERWGRYWSGGPSAHVRRLLGDDAGCFAAALASVQRWGGVLEHPEGSHAWRAFNLVAPAKNGKWCRAGLFARGWTCCVEQGHYGHKARKATWLYLCNADPPELTWGASAATARLDGGYHSTEERRRAIKTDVVQRLSKRERSATPTEFRDLLIAMAESGEARR